MEEREFLESIDPEIELLGVIFRELLNPSKQRKGARKAMGLMTEQDSVYE